MKIINVCCVYAIGCKPTDELYVGGTYCYYSRVLRHLRELRKGIHYNKGLQEAFNTYGEAAFTFEILEKCSKATVREVEQKWIVTLDTTTVGKGFNKTPHSGKTSGYQWTDDQRKAKSHIRKGRFLGVENPMFGQKRPRAMIEMLREKSAKEYVLCSPIGQHIEVKNLNEFSRTLFCDPTSARSFAVNLHKTFNGKLNTYKGWKIISKQ